MKYLIAYDINDFILDYSDLKDKIKSLGEFQHPLESVWFIKTKEYLDVKDIYNNLKEYLHSDKDHLFIMEFNKDTKRSGWMQKYFWKWIKE